ncbi:MAG: alanine racemase [Chloroflexi bacterium HGW-Chloroflexi-10]|nr:MAG: alanine racemase [Chloroflexi bacterium HGW-Chloroflexi-10]
MGIFSTITKPTLLLDEAKGRKNLLEMVEKAKKQNIKFRPHFKTHQSAEIGEWFREAGIRSITVSSVEMAQYFAMNGWEDILIAFPVNIREIEAIVQLSSQIHLSLLVESVEVVEKLAKHLRKMVDIWIKINVGNDRSGIHYQDSEAIIQLVQTINLFGVLQFQGLLTHAGQTYKATSVHEVERIHHQSVSRLQDLVSLLAQNRISPVKISVGDTPSARLVPLWGLVDEVRPGNFLFFDMQQAQKNVCTLEEIAVCLMAPVIAVYPERNEAVIYGGAIHLSKDSYQDGENLMSYGLVVRMTASGWDVEKPLGWLRSLSQEHGVIHFFDSSPVEIKAGDLVGVLPAHSCLTVQAMRYFLNQDGERIDTLLSV